MEAKRFDHLAKLVAGLASRRTLVRGAAAGGLATALGLVGAGVVPGFGDEAEAGKRKKKRRRRKRRKQKKQKRRCEKKCATDDICLAAKCNKKGKCKIRESENVGKECDANDECCSGVCGCADPTGWATHPDADGCQGTSYTQNFEKNRDHWYNFRDSFFHAENETFPPTDEVIERVRSHNGISPKSGEFFALVKSGDAYQGDYTPLSTLGAFSNVFPDGGIDVSLDIYLDPEGSNDGETFSYSVALNKTDCEHQQDFVFNAGKTAGAFCVSTSTGAFTGNDPCGQTAPINPTEAGWYTFEHHFERDGGDIAVTMRLLDAQGEQVTGGIWERTVDQPGETGGNRYAWFPVNTYDAVAIDNSMRTS